MNENEPPSADGLATSAVFPIIPGIEATGRVFPLDELTETHHLMETGGAIGKPVVRID